MENTLTCAGCSKSINSKDEYTILKTSKRRDIESILCPDCWNKHIDAIEQETLDPNFIRALMTGAVGAAIAGLIWYYFVTLTNFQFGLVSVLMGWLVGKSIVLGAGNKRGKPLQFLSVSLTIVAIIFSEYLILNHYFIEEFGSGYGNLTLSDFFTAYGFYFSEASGFINLIFYAIALWQAYITPRMRVAAGTTVNQGGFVGGVVSQNSGEEEWEKSVEEKGEELSLEERWKRGGILPPKDKRNREL